MAEIQPIDMLVRYHYQYKYIVNKPISDNPLPTFGEGG